MARLSIYCSVGFLSALYTYVDKPLIEWLEDDEADAAKKLYKFIHKEADVLLDASINEYLISSSDKYLKRGKHP
jgi:hypothetical protein